MVINADFTHTVLQWHDIAGRKHLPWQITPSEQGTWHGVYKVWLSEVMLQQTQVTTVIDYFTGFIAQFATVQALAAANWDQVASRWAGLGYYARARNLHACAQQLASMRHPPETLAEWVALPGIGRSTAGAIMALGMGKYGVILDANVRRVLGRVYTPQASSMAEYNAALWLLAEQHSPMPPFCGQYAQAMMDLGALICSKNPVCALCPVQSSCNAHTNKMIALHPFKLPKKTKPTKHAYAYVCRNHLGEILWVKRPSIGIWGGLWTLVLSDFTEEPPAVMLPQNTSILAVKSVVFTHFNLEIQVLTLPISIEYSPHTPVLTPLLNNGCNPTLKISANIEHQWITRENAKTLAMPAVMQKILALL